MKRNKLVVPGLVLLILLIAGGASWLGSQLYELVWHPLPQLYVEPQSLQVGAVPAGGTFEHSIKVVNRGTAPLIITKISTSCRCTTAKHPEAAILPGEADVISFKVATTRQEGEFGTRVGIFTNETQSPQHDFELVWKSMQLVNISPRDCFLGDISAQELPHTKKIALSAGSLADERTMSTLQAVSDSPYIRCSLLDEDPKQLEVTLSAGVPLGTVREKILLRAGSPVVYTYEILVVGNVLGDYKAVPAALLFDSFDDHGRQSLTFRLVGLRGDDQLVVDHGEPQATGLASVTRNEGHPDTLEVTATEPESSANCQSALVVKIVRTGLESPQLVQIPIIRIRNGAKGQAAGMAMAEEVALRGEQVGDQRTGEEQE